jgi:hypothetical protein
VSGRAQRGDERRACQCIADPIQPNEKYFHGLKALRPRGGP